MLEADALELLSVDSVGLKHGVRDHRLVRRNKLHRGPAD
jgi:hypothetical protein